MDFEMVKGKAEKCKNCGEEEARFLSDYFLLQVAPPSESTEKQEADLHGSGGYLSVKVKQCKRCHFLELYQPTDEELIEYAKGREITKEKFTAMPRGRPV